MPLDTLADAFYDELRDILHAEKALVKALPKVAKAATNPELVAAVESHLEETKKHVARCEEAFTDTGKAARAKTCVAMEGLLKEAENMMGEEADPEVMDAVIICCAQKVEHYEIATYGTLCTWADLLGYPTALKALKQNLAEEEATDKKLSSLSRSINLSAKA